MAIHITYDEALQDLREIVQEFGEDYVYPHSNPSGSGCQYFEPDGTPSCIVGHLLLRKGLTLDGLMEYGHYNRGNGVEHLSDVGIIEVDSDTLYFLSEAQGAQDTGLTWGEALASAIEAVND